MKIAAIDVGTNTILLLLAEIGPEGALRPVLHEQRFPRLGKGVDAGGHLAPEAMARGLDAIEEYQRLLIPHRPDRVVLCGTSAVRDARNRAEFVDMVARETGLSLEILSGSDEAYWTYRGALTNVTAPGQATVVDIGGGSTEITIGSADAVERTISLQIGSVRLTERCFHHDPPTDPELEAAIAEVEEALAITGGLAFAGSTLIGVAGTATSLARLARGSSAFDPEAHPQRMPSEVVEHLFQSLRSMPSATIRTLSDAMEGRADIITAGALILREVMARFGFDEVVVTEGGLRHGLVLREVERI